MSGRQIARLRKQGELLQAVAESSSSEDDEAGPAAAPFNPFDLLTDDEPVSRLHMELKRGGPPW